MQTETSAGARPSPRLAAVRRLYVYLMAFASLLTGLFGFSGLVDTLSRYWLGVADPNVLGNAYYARSVALNAGLLLVATPLFLSHWWIAQRHQREPEERASFLRKLFLYAASATSLLILIVNAYLLIDALARITMGAWGADRGIEAADWVNWGVLIAAHSALVAYWYTILVSDEDYGHESTGGRIVRQIFLAFFALAGLFITMWGAADLLRTGLQLLVRQLGTPWTGDWWRASLSSGLAQLIVGGWLLHTVRAQWQTIIGAQAREAPSAFRRIYLYVAVVVGALATLAPLALVLRELLLMVFNRTDAGAGDLLRELVDPLSFVPVGLVVWLLYWRQLEREADAYGESAQGAVVRRLYYYLVAATGLALTWVGAVLLLQTLLDLWVIAQGEASFWAEPLATALSLLAVGAPVWALHWRAVQRVARQPDAQGAVERNALVRRIYLYGVALVGALILLFELAQVVYRLLLLVMGDPSIDLVTTQTLHQLANVLVAVVLWGVHLLAIRGDGLSDKDRPAPEPPPAEDPGQRRAQLQAEIEQLEAKLTALQGGTGTE